MIYVEQLPRDGELGARSSREVTASFERRRGASSGSGSGVGTKMTSPESSELAIERAGDSTRIISGNAKIEKKGKNMRIYL